MTCIDVEGWIDTVQAKLNELMSNRFPEASAEVTIPYTTQLSAQRASGVPRIEWGEAPQFEADYVIMRPCHEDGALAKATVTLNVALIAANVADCRALLTNLLIAILAADENDPTDIKWPVVGKQFARAVNENGRLAQRIDILLPVHFTVPEDPQPIGVWDPTAPFVEETVEHITTNVQGDSFTQPEE